MGKQEIIDYVNKHHIGFGAFAFKTGRVKGVYIEDERTHKGCLINDKFLDDYAEKDVDKIVNDINFR